MKITSRSLGINIAVMSIQVFVNPKTQKKKDISNDLRETPAAGHQAGKGHKIISKQLELYCEYAHSHVETIQDRCQSFQGWTS